MQKNFLSFFKNLRPIHKQIFALITGTILLSAAAFYNGFPLVFSDTIDYIAASIKLRQPFYRQMGYGVFEFLTTFNTNLWTVILAQSFIMSLCLYYVLKKIVKEKIDLMHILIISFLTAFTTASWYASQLMPDIFTPMIVLLIFLYLVNNFKWWLDLIFLFLFFGLLVSHTANFLLSLGILVSLGIYFLWKKEKIKDAKLIIKKIGILCLVSITSMFAIMTINFVTYKLFATNAGSHVFLMARLDESGILKQFLGENCQTTNYKLCAYKDTLPTNGEEFIWSAKSYHHIVGWYVTRPEYEAIISKILWNPKYLEPFIVDSVIRSTEILFHNGLDSFGAYNTDTNEGYSITKIIQKNFPAELDAYTSAKQYNYELKFLDNISNLTAPIILLSFIFLIYAFIKFHLSFEEKFLSTIIIMAWIYNGIIMATLSGVHDRYNSRLSWLIPFLALVLLSKKITQKK